MLLLLRRVHFRGTPGRQLTNFHLPSLFTHTRSEAHVNGRLRQPTFPSYTVVHGRTESNTSGRLRARCGRGVTSAAALPFLAPRATPPAAPGALLTRRSLSSHRSPPRVRIEPPMEAILCQDPPRLLRSAVRGFPRPTRFPPRSRGVVAAAGVSSRPPSPPASYAGFRALRGTGWCRGTGNPPSTSAHRANPSIVAHAGRLNPRAHRDRARFRARSGVRRPSAWAHQERTAATDAGRGWRPTKPRKSDKLVRDVRDLASASGAATVPRRRSLLGHVRRAPGAWHRCIHEHPFGSTRHPALFGTDRALCAPPCAGVMAPSRPAGRNDPAKTA